MRYLCMLEPQTLLSRQMLTFNLCNVDSEIIEDAKLELGFRTVDMKRETVTYAAATVESINVYTGMLAPTKTAYIDVIGTDGKSRTFLIAGHVHAKTAMAAAKKLGIKVTGETL